MKQSQSSKPVLAEGEHSVLPGADNLAYRSLLVRPISRKARFAIGRQLRDTVPRAAGKRFLPGIRSKPPNPLRNIKARITES